MSAHAKRRAEASRLVEPIEEMRAPIAAAAEWWGSVARAPSFDAGGDLSSRVASSMMDRIAERNRTPEDAIPVFRAELERLLHWQTHESVEYQRERNERDGFSGDDPLDGVYLALDVDYGPSGLLHDAAEKAGVRALPWKTHMYIGRYVVSVSEGYRASDATIWTSPRVPADDPDDRAAVRYVEVSSDVEQRRRHEENMSRATREERARGERHQPDYEKRAIARAGDLRVLADPPSEDALARAIDRGLLREGRPAPGWAYSPKKEPPYFRLELTPLGRVVFNLRVRDELSKANYPEDYR